MTDLSDEQLMIELAAGNPDALPTLQARYEGALLSYVQTRIVGNDAEAVVKAVFARVQKHCGAFKPTQSFVAWLYALADRLSKNANRDYARQTEVAI